MHHHSLYTKIVRTLSHIPTWSAHDEGGGTSGVCRRGGGGTEPLGGGVLLPLGEPEGTGKSISWLFCSPSRIYASMADTLRCAWRNLFLAAAPLGGGGGDVVFCCGMMKFEVGGIVVSDGEMKVEWWRPGSVGGNSCEGCSAEVKSNSVSPGACGGSVNGAGSR